MIGIPKKSLSSLPDEIKNNLPHGYQLTPEVWLVLPEQKLLEMQIVFKKYWDLAAFFVAWLLIFLASEIVEKTSLSYRNLIGLALLLFAISLLRLGSRFKTSMKKFSSHSDPDVAALVDARIDIAEYRKRKEDKEKAQR